MNGLTKEQLAAVIEGRGRAERVPMLYNMWMYPEAFGEQLPQLQEIQRQYPYDMDDIHLHFPEMYRSEEPGSYSWTQKPAPPDLATKAMDNAPSLESWDDLDDLLAAFPSSSHPSLIPDHKPTGKYRLARWWYCFFERLWSFRGMENALTDFYLYPDQVHRLFDHLTTFYTGAMDRAKHELDADGIFTSDDIGTQNAPFFSLDIFREFFKPYYKRMIDHAHSLGMHMWLHSCGSIEMFLPEFIEIGLDVIHPIQKHTMDEARIAATYGSQICIMAGFDVQQTIPYGTPEQVRQEVRHLIDTFARTDGRFLLTTGNAATPDWTIPSIYALYNESYHHGLAAHSSL